MIIGVDVDRYDTAPEYKEVYLTSSQEDRRGRVQHGQANEANTGGMGM